MIGISVCCIPCGVEWSGLIPAAQELFQTMLFPLTPLMTLSSEGCECSAVDCQELWGARPGGHQQSALGGRLARCFLHPFLCLFVNLYWKYLGHVPRPTGVRLQDASWSIQCIAEVPTTCSTPSVVNPVKCQLLAPRTHKPQ